MSYYFFSLKLIGFAILFNVKSHSKQFCAVFRLIMHSYMSTPVSIILISKLTIPEQNKWGIFPARAYYIVVPSTTFIILFLSYSKDDYLKKSSYFMNIEKKMIATLVPSVSVALAIG